MSGHDLLKLEAELAKIRTANGRQPSAEFDRVLIEIQKESIAA